MSYPFRIIGNNINRKLIGVAMPAVNAQQLASKSTTGVADNYRGAWTSTTNVNQGDMFVYGQTMWLALTPSYGITPATGTSQWQSLGSYSAYRGAWNSTTNYVLGDETTYGGNFWLATAGSLNQIPATGSAYWQIAGPTNLDNIADGVTYVRGRASEFSGNYWDHSLAGNATSQASYLSAISGRQTNLCPDSGFQFGQVYWQPSGHAVGPYKGGFDGTNNALLLGPGIGAALTGSWYTRINIPVQASTTYTLSAAVIGNALISGSPTVGVWDVTGTTNYGSFNLPTTGGLQRVSAQVTIPSGVTDCIIKFHSNGAAWNTGQYIGIQQVQLEANATMTGYRGSYDNNGYSTLLGSGPVTIGNGSISYTTTTTSIAFSWAAGTILLADTTNIAYASQASAGCNSLTPGTNYWFYPYYDTIAGIITFAFGGTGTGTFGGAAYTAPSTAGSNIQNAAYHVPYSNGGILIPTPSSGTGGGSGGGNKCLHPEMELSINGTAKFAYDLREADKLLAPGGGTVVETVARKPQSDWIKARLSNGELLLATPSHRLFKADGDTIRMDELTLKSILKADGCFVTVEGLENFEEDAKCVSFSVEGHVFLARAGGVWQHNTNQKP